MGIFNIFRKTRSYYPFKERKDLPVITCIHCTNKERPILHVVHDTHGDWQFLCGQSHEENEARVVALETIYDLDNSLGELAGLKRGFSADRTTQAHKWEVK